MKQKTPVAFLLGLWIAIPILALFIGHHWAAGARGMPIGARLPQARLETLTGAPVETSDWLGRPTLLVLYQSSCPACSAEIGALGVLAPYFPGLRIELLSIDRAPPRTAISFEVVTDRSGDFLRQARRLMVPVAYGIDSSGVVRLTAAGQRTAPELREILQRLSREEKP
jgi:peroxiredoxin